jgi:hypothetical protein
MSPPGLQRLTSTNSTPTRLSTVLSSIKTQIFGSISCVILLVGFMGLVVPIALHWNHWILVFAIVRKFIVVPCALALIGLFMDRPKYAALVALFGTVALYLSPGFIEIASTLPSGRPAASMICFVDQSGMELEHITLNVNGKPLELPKTKYWSRVAKFAAMPIRNTADLSLTADVGFVGAEPIKGEIIATNGSGDVIRHLIVFIRPDRKFDVIPFQ